MSAFFAVLASAIVIGLVGVAPASICAAGRSGDRNRNRCGPRFSPGQSAAGWRGARAGLERGRRQGPAPRPRTFFLRSRSLEKAEQETAHLLGFIQHGVNSHATGMWRDPKDKVGWHFARPDYWQHMARTMERGLFDAMFIATNWRPTTRTRRFRRGRPMGGAMPDPQTVDHRADHHHRDRHLASA